MAFPRRAGRARGRAGSGLRPGVVVSALLHLGLAALALLAAMQREKLPEPLPPPSYAVEFEAGAPERPAQQAAPPAPDGAEAAAEAEAPPPEQPRAAEAEPPPPEPTRAPPSEAPEAPPEEARTAEVEPPRPENLPIPPPAPPPPQREAALTAPPRPARPPQPERLPGLWLPDARFSPNPLPPRPQPQRRGLDLSPGALHQPGRDSPEAQLSVRGAQVGPDWRNAFRRWMDDHGRYPPNAALVGEQGTTRIELIVEPDGRVRSGRLLRRSGSVWLDAGTVSLFRNAVLPPFPPGADPAGVTVDLTINYILVR